VLRELKNGKFDDKIDKYLGPAPPGGEAASSSTPVPVAAVAPPGDPDLALVESTPPVVDTGVPQAILDEAATLAVQGKAAEGSPRDTIRPGDLHALQVEGDLSTTLRDAVPAHVAAGTSVPTSFDGPVPAAVDWAESGAIEVPEAQGGSWEITEPAAADSRPAGVVPIRPPGDTRVREPARAEPPPRTSTSFVARPNQKERPFEKSGKFPPVNLPEGAEDRSGVPQPIGRADSTSYSHTRRKTGPPPSGEFQAPQQQRSQGRGAAPVPKAPRPTPSAPAQERQGLPPSQPPQKQAAQRGGGGNAQPAPKGQHAWMSSPPGPAPRPTGSAPQTPPRPGFTPPAKSNQTIYSPGAPPARPGTPPPVATHPAVIINAPPQTVGGEPPAAAPARRPSTREAPKPPDSIFGQDRLSEKSLDEVILAYLSEDSKEDSNT
jgi:hypothetical protein